MRARRAAVRVRPLDVLHAGRAQQVARGGPGRGRRGRREVGVGYAEGEGAEEEGGRGAAEEAGGRGAVEGFFGGAGVGG